MLGFVSDGNQPGEGGMELMTSDSQQNTKVKQEAPYLLSRSACERVRRKHLLKVRETVGSSIE